MSKKSEDRLESFFRKAVNQSDSSFMEQDWQAMQKKLDENPMTSALHQARIRNRKIAVTTTAIAVLFAAYFFTLRTDQPLVGEEGSTNQQAAAGVEVPKQRDKEKENQTADLLPLYSAPNVTAGDATPGPPESTSKTSILSDDPRQPTITELTEKPILPGTGRVEAKVETEVLRPTYPLATVPEKVTDPAGHDLKEPSVISDEHQTNVTSKEELSERKEVEESALGTLAEGNQAGNPEEDTKTSGSRWNIALAIAPDFSTTSLKNYSSPGSAVGILVGYQLHKRISVNIGLMRSSKRYTGYGNDYQPPYGYWKARTNGIIPNEIYGSCRILEIPLIIQYDILQRSRARVFAGGGISTYLMSHEEYQYRFSTPNPGADQGWSSEGATSSYPLAIGHFSLGYERQVSPRVSVGVEPFLKVPFAGIGWTDIQLFTTGAFVNIRYRMAGDAGFRSTNH